MMQINLKFLVGTLVLVACCIVNAQTIEFKDTIIYKTQAIPCFIVKVDSDGVYYTNKVNSFNPAWNQKFIYDLYEELNMAFVDIKDVKRYNLADHPLHTKKSPKIEPPVCESNKIEKTVDEFDGTVTYRYRIDWGPEIVTFIKIIKKGITKYYISIWIEANGIYTGTGTTILLCNEQKIEKPQQKVDYELIRNSFYSTAFIPITLAELNKITKCDGMKYKLYISKGGTSYSPDELNCLIKLKF